MRRLAFLACLILAAPAWGAQPGWYDVADYVDVPGQPCDSAVEEAYQAAKAYGKPATIHFGPGLWTFDRPFLADLDGLAIVGAGRGTTTLAPARGSGFAPIILGIRREPRGLSLTAGHRPDAFGKLDAGMAPAPGVRFGYRTMGDAHLGLWASPFDGGAGEDWRQIRKLTIAWCSEGGVLAFGMHGGPGGSVPIPWAIRQVDDAGGQVFDFRCRDGAYRSFTWKVPGDPAALHRSAVQIDLEAATYQAFVDGVQVPTVARPGAGKGGASFTPADGLQFHPRPRGPFLVGQLGASMSGRTGQTPDRTIYALRLSAGCLYKDGGAGAPMARVDGRREDDGHYFANSPDLIACLSAVGPTGAGDRLVPWMAGAASGQRRSGFGLFLHSGAQGGGHFSTRSNSFRGLTVDLGGARWGQALSTGGTFDLDVRDVELKGGWHGLGSAPIGGSWPTWVVDVKATGYDAAISLFSHIVAAQRLDLGWPGTTALRMEGCAGTVRDVFMSGQTVRGEFTIDIFGRDDSMLLTLENVQCNQEGLPYPTVAGIRIEAPRVDWDVPATVVLRDIRWGNVGPDASLVRLEDGGGKVPCHFTLDGAYMETSNIGVVTTGPRWEGTVRPGAIAGKRWVVHDGPGKSGVVLVDEHGISRGPRE
jgi:hypothetical protein